MQGIDMEGNILPWGGLDHWPVLLEANFQGTPKNRPFHFECFWIEHPTFKENINLWWKEDIQVQGTKMYRFQVRLKHIKKKLKQWNQEVFGNIDQAKKYLEEKMGRIQEICIQEGYNEERKRRRAICIRNERKYVSKRKFFGDRNPEFNGERKGRKTQSSSIGRQ
jgi:hypothetical protein